MEKGKQQRASFRGLTGKKATEEFILEMFFAVLYAKPSKPKPKDPKDMKKMKLLNVKLKNENLEKVNLLIEEAKKGYLGSKRKLEELEQKLVALIESKSEIKENIKAVVADYCYKKHVDRTLL